MAEYAKRFLEIGVKVIGGCCGTTPAHIREIAKAVRPLARISTASPAPVSISAVPRKKQPEFEGDELSVRVTQMEKVRGTALLYSKSVFSKEVSPLRLLYAATYFHKKLLKIPSYVPFFEKIADNNVALAARLLRNVKS